jgi:hypothetical protein
MATLDGGLLSWCGNWMVTPSSLFLTAADAADVFGLQHL